MKRLLALVAFLSLVMAGCKQPPEVTLQDEDELEVTSVAPPDSNLTLASVDSSAILPEDHVKFAGLLQVISAKFDGGQVVRSIAFSRVVFEHRNRPVLDSGRITGYSGVDLGFLVTLNGGPMLRIPHRVVKRFSRRDTTAGFEYFKDLTTSFLPRTTYTWRALPDSIGSLSASIETPEDLTVYSPKGGTVVSRDQDLELSWRGQGNLTFVISKYNPLKKETKPLFLVKARVNRSHAVLSRKLLRLLPRERFFVFTFVLSNRKELEAVSSFPGRILVQATTVYNSYVEIR